VGWAPIAADSRCINELHVYTPAGAVGVPIRTSGWDCDAGGDGDAGCDGDAGGDTASSSTSSALLIVHLTTNVDSRLCPLIRLLGTHYRKLSLVVTLLLCLSLG